MEPFASIPEFHDRVPGGVTSDDTARARAMLEDASALIAAEAGKTWEGETVPDIVKTVCISAAKRAFLNPEGVTNLSLDGHSAGFATASPDVFLTKAEKSAIRRAGGRSGLWTLTTTRADGDVGDVPAVTVAGTITPEETDPFLEGWPG